MSRILIVVSGGTVTRVLTGSSEDVVAILKRNTIEETEMFSLFDNDVIGDHHVSNYLYTKYCEINTLLKELEEELKLIKDE